MNYLKEECTKENAKVVSEFVDEDVITVGVDMNEYLMPFSTFYERITVD